MSVRVGLEPRELGVFLQSADAIRDKSVSGTSDVSGVPGEDWLNGSNLPLG